MNIAIFLASLVVLPMQTSVSEAPTEQPAGVICKFLSKEISAIKKNINNEEDKTVLLKSDSIEVPRLYYPSGKLKYLKILQKKQVFLVDDFDVIYFPAKRFVPQPSGSSGVDRDGAGVRAFSNYSRQEMRTRICGS